MAERPTRGGPRNQSRGAGRAAPASAAATEPANKPPPASFYRPGAAQVEESMLARQLAASADAGERAPEATEQHIEEVRRQAIDHEEMSVDHAIAARGLGADGPERGDDEVLDARRELAGDIDRIRQMRRPLGAFTQKLALAKRAGYHSHWFNDEGGRIDDALANGWAHRKDDEGKPIRRAVGRGRDAGVLYAYAMDIPEVFWLEDMSARHEAAAGKMDSLKAAPFRAQAGASKPSDAGKFYSPAEVAEPLSIEKR